VTSQHSVNTLNLIALTQLLVMCSCSTKGRESLLVGNRENEAEGKATEEEVGRDRGGRGDKI